MLQRLHKEYAEIKRLKDFDVVHVNGDSTHWKGYIAGPEGTPYTGGTYVLDITFPTTYPFYPPKIKFDTRVWHPNISSANGAICLDILKDKWTPAMTARTTLLSLQSLLAEPNPDDPQDAVVAQEYRRDLKAWQRRAREWAVAYAGAKVDAGSAKPSISTK